MFYTLYVTAQFLESNAFDRFTKPKAPRFMNEPGNTHGVPTGSSDSVIPIVDASLVTSGETVLDAELVEPKHEPTDSSGEGNRQLSTDASLPTSVPVSVNSQPIESAPPIVHPAESLPSQGNPDLDSVNSEPVDSENSPGVRPVSWVFRVFAWFARLASHLFGIASIIFLLAVAASIPIVQFLSFGYLLEVSGRLARQQPVRDVMIGLDKATKLGSLVLGTWLTLLPIRFVSELWHEAYLIDAASPQTQGMRIFQVILIGLAVLHIAASWMCGGKLRYFFWPIVAPFSFGVWIARKIAGWKVLRGLLSVTTGWISPHLVDDICNAQSISDWFLPAICYKRIREGKLYTRSRDAVWNFVASLNLKYYFLLGFKGFLGSFAWLFFPTMLLVVASSTKDGAAILSGLFGVLFAIPIFMMLPFLQAHFARDGKLKRFSEVRAVFKNFGRAPLAHFIALLITLVLALPLFFLKIEEIPHELLWTLSLVFIVFSWPARISLGWAYRRGAKSERLSRWWIRIPCFLLAAPVALAFVLILTLTRYVSWYGAISLYENHVFLLPAPFWL